MLALGLDMDEFDNAAEKFNTFSQLIFNKHFLPSFV